MANENPLTKSDLVAALKEANVATKDDLEELGQQVKDEIRDATDSVLKGVDKLHAKHEKRFDKLEKQIDDLKWDTPSNQAFNELKAKVDRYHPTPS